MWRACAPGGALVSSTLRSTPRGVSSSWITPNGSPSALLRCATADGPFAQAFREELARTTHTMASKQNVERMATPKRISSALAPAPPSHWSLNSYAYGLSEFRAAELPSRGRQHDGLPERRAPGREGGATSSRVCLPWLA